MTLLAVLFERQFFSGEYLRWNLGWATPNYAGAFVVVLLPLWWSLGGSRWRWAALVAEAIGLFLLAKTYSRGAAVAWVAAWLFGALAVRAWRHPAQRALWSFRLGLLVVALLTVDFSWDRIPVGEVHEVVRPGTSAAVDLQSWRGLQTGPADGDTAGIKDRSIGNRLVVWRGGLSMIASAPLTGWGGGESGRSYMNWFQGLDREESYFTMVNSYLSLAIDRGLLWLGVILWGYVWLFLLAWQGARRSIGTEHAGNIGTNETAPAAAGAEPRTTVAAPISPLLSPSLFAAAGGSLMAWVVASIFTTLWIEPALWIAPGIAAAIIFGATWASRRATRWGQNGLISGTCALLLVGGLYGGGHWIGTTQRWIIEPGPASTVRVAARSWGANLGAEMWHVWPDTSVLGPLPGKELRRWIETRSGPLVMIVHRPEPCSGPPDLSSAEGVLLFGKQAERLGRDPLPNGRQLWLIHPWGTPPRSPTEPTTKPGPDEPPQIVVVLPAIDETGRTALWRQWAESHHARVLFSPGVGQDIRLAWPAVLANAESTR